MGWEGNSLAMLRWSNQVNAMTGAPRAHLMEAKPSTPPFDEFYEPHFKEKTKHWMLYHKQKRDSMEHTCKSWTSSHPYSWSHSIREREMDGYQMCGWEIGWNEEQVQPPSGACMETSTNARGVLFNVSFIYFYYFSILFLCFSFTHIENNVKFKCREKKNFIFVLTFFNLV